MMSKKPFIDQEISYINIDGEMKLSTMSNYMKYVLGIIEIENKKCYVCYNTKTPIELVSDNLLCLLMG